MLTRFVAPGLLLALFSADAAAGSVRAILKDEHGAPLAGIRLTLTATDAGAGYGQRALTDAGGRATFADLPAGQYRLESWGTSGRFVLPENNPLAPQPLVTLAAGQENVDVEWVLWRGVEVYCRVTVDRGEIRSARVRFLELDLGTEVTLFLRNPPEGSIRLIPGRWQAMLEPIAGLLLESVEVDGRASAGYLVPLDLQPLMSPVDLAWGHRSPAELYGRVTFEGDDFGVGIVARLVEPGPWVEAAEARGGSSYRQVSAGVSLEDGTYEMRLPDGLWQVQPVGDQRIASDPESMLLQIPAGGSERADFTVSGEKSEGATLLVSVMTPDDGMPEDAVVEIWPLDPSERQDQPVERVFPRRSFVMVRGLPPGDYLVAAAAPGFVEGQEQLPAFGEEEQQEARRVLVRLRQGATVHGTVRVEDDVTRAPELLLRMERQGDEIPGVIRHEEHVARVLNPLAVSDSTGHAWIRGLYPGDYELTAELAGHGRGGFVRIDDDGKLEDRRTIGVEGVETHDVELVLVPAAELHGSLACSDEGLMPAGVGFVAIDNRHDLTTLDEETMLLEAALKLDDLRLTGDLHDAFRAGPLAEGFYHVAFRPAGYDRWTWALGTERPDEAATVQGVPGEEADLGVVELDCGPVIRLTPVLREGAVPDLRGVSPGRRAARVRGNVTSGRERRTELNVTVEPFPDRVLLRGLPAGEAELELTLINGYFLPEPQVTVPVIATLERGRTLDVSVPVPGIGGRLVLLEAPQGSAATLSDASGNRRLQAAVDGRIVFDSLASGEYRLTHCSDAECLETMGVASSVAIEALRTLEHGFASAGSAAR